jgi:hypothetical protein
LVQEGEDIFVVQKRMRHKTIVMTMRYAHLSPHNMESSVSIIDSKWDDKSETTGKTSTAVKNGLKL